MRLLDKRVGKFLIEDIDNREIVFIGDIHGEIDKLKEVCDWVELHYPKAYIYCTGDLCDRGANTKEVVDLCIQTGLDCVMGNHDDLMLRALNGTIQDYFGHVFATMGGAATVKSYVGIKQEKFSGDELFVRYKELVPQLHKDYISSFPNARLIKTTYGDFLLTHAGANRRIVNEFDRNYWRSTLINDENLELFVDRYSDTLMWEHSLDQADMRKRNIYQIFGHYPVRVESMVQEHYTDCDSGSGKSGPLSCVVFPTKEVFTSR